MVRRLACCHPFYEFISQNRDFTPQLQKFELMRIRIQSRVFREQIGEPIRRVGKIALQLLDLFSHWHLLLLERLDLILQLSSLMRFVNSRSGNDRERGRDKSFLECGHGNGFGGGN